MTVERAMAAPLCVCERDGERRRERGEVRNRQREREGEKREIERREKAGDRGRESTCIIT